MSKTFLWIADDSNPYIGYGSTPTGLIEPKVKVFAGIGSRETPKNLLPEIVKLSKHLAEKGWYLRSGGAEGADAAFEEGYKDFPDQKMIFLPWEKFNKNDSCLFPPTEKAKEIANKFHPAWSKCNGPARLLLARNSHQILGIECDRPCDLVICWTKDGKEEGGTGQALRIAKAYNIKIINLADHIK